MKLVTMLRISYWLFLFIAILMVMKVPDDKLLWSLIPGGLAGLILIIKFYRQSKLDRENTGQQFKDMVGL